MSDSVQPHRWQPTMVPCPWDSPGKNTGVGCHFLLPYQKKKRERDIREREKRKKEKKDVLVIRGDWNAKVESQEIARVIGKFVPGEQNEAGQRLI